MVGGQGRPETRQQKAMGREKRFVVEKVLSKREVNGRTEFEIKWLHFDASQNSWEPRDNLDCPALISEFERNQAKKGRQGNGAVPEAGTSSASSSQGDEERDKKGFERGLEPERILGCCLHEGRPIFLIKWKNSGLKDLVLAEEANRRCPQLVIQFHQKRLSWKPSRDEVKDEDSS